MPHDEHAGLRADLMRSCGLSATVPLSSPDAAMRLLAAARVASIDAREVYFSPASGWGAKVIAPPVAGRRSAVALSPRNETAACALVLELLTDAHRRAPGAAATLEAARALCDAALRPRRVPRTSTGTRDRPKRRPRATAASPTPRSRGSARRRRRSHRIVQDVHLRRARAVPRDGTRRRRHDAHPRGRRRRRHPRRTPVLGQARPGDARPAGRRVPHVRRAGRGHDRGVVAHRRASAGRGEPVARRDRLASVAGWRRGKRVAVRRVHAGVVAARGARRPPRGHAAAGGCNRRGEKLARQHAALFPALSDCRPTSFPRPRTPWTTSGARTRRGTRTV